LRSFKLCH